MNFKEKLFELLHLKVKENELNNTNFIKGSTEMITDLQYIVAILIIGIVGTLNINKEKLEFFVDTITKDFKEMVMEEFDKKDGVD